MVTSRPDVDSAAVKRIHHGDTEGTEKKSEWKNENRREEEEER